MMYIDGEAACEVRSIWPRYQVPNIHCVLLTTLFLWFGALVWEAGMIEWERLAC